MKLAVLTSGGDAPGMNAAIRSVVRFGVSQKMQIIGVQGGYEGLCSGKLVPLNLRSVANIIQRGGTFLKTGRYPEFLKKEVRQLAIKNLKKHHIEALICIGGDGSCRGAIKLSEEGSFPVIGIPATIDNDLYNTNFTIGFDTAVNTALQAIDRIRDTAESHERLFLIEVMGRASDFIALHVGLASGAEDILLNTHKSFDPIIERLKKSQSKGKKSLFIVVSEGPKPGRVYHLSQKIEQTLQIKPRICVLGHVQRGGAPSAYDRSLAGLMGAHAVKAILDNKNLKMVAVKRNEILLVDMKEAVTQKKKAPQSLLALIHTLAN